MQVPKRKHSKSRTRQKRNGHYTRDDVNTIVCKNCGAQKLPHFLCKECGK